MEDLKMLVMSRMLSDRNSAPDGDLVLEGIRSLSSYLENLQHARAFSGGDPKSNSQMLEYARSVAILVAVGTLTALEKIHAQARTAMPKSFRALAELVMHISARAARQQEQGSRQDETKEDDRKAKQMRKAERKLRRNISRKSSIGEGQDVKPAEDSSGHPEKAGYVSRKQLAKKAGKDQANMRRSSRRSRRFSTTTATATGPADGDKTLSTSQQVAADAIETENKEMGRKIPKHLAKQRKFQKLMLRMLGDEGRGKKPKKYWFPNAELGISKENGLRARQLAEILPPIHEQSAEGN